MSDSSDSSYSSDSHDSPITKRIHSSDSPLKKKTIIKKKSKDPKEPEEYNNYIPKNKSFVESLKKIFKSGDINEIRKQKELMRLDDINESFMASPSGPFRYNLQKYKEWKLIYKSHF